jgi:hypothetical protein
VIETFEEEVLATSNADELRSTIDALSNTLWFIGVVIFLLAFTTLLFFYFGTRMLPKRAQSTCCTRSFAVVHAGLVVLCIVFAGLASLLMTSASGAEVARRAFSNFCAPRQTGALDICSGTESTTCLALSQFSAQLRNVKCGTACKTFCARMLDVKGDSRTFVFAAVLHLCAALLLLTTAPLNYARSQKGDADGYTGVATGAQDIDILHRPYAQRTAVERPVLESSAKLDLKMKKKSKSGRKNGRS